MVDPQSAENDAPEGGVSAESADSFCAMPFIHLHLTQEGRVTPCCQAPDEASMAFCDIRQSSIEEIWNGAPFRDFRARMLAGQRDARCSGCFQKEAEGLASLRSTTNRRYAQLVRQLRAEPPGDATAPPIYLDLRFSNHCNLKCRICGPVSSSAWHQDAVALGWRAAGSPSRSKCTDDMPRLWGQVRGLASGLKEIYFAGGEPLLMEEHYQLLELLIELGNTGVHLQYNTNFSVLDFKAWSAPSLWRQFSDVTLSASLDGMGARGEYQRANLRWNEVCALRERLRREAPHVRFFITPTASLFNILHLPEFNRTMAAEGFIGAFDFVPSLLTRPPEYSVRTLPPPLKRQASRQIDEHLAWLAGQQGDTELRQFVLRQWGSLKRHMNAHCSAQLLPQFLERTQTLDQLRGERFGAVFPELAHLGDWIPSDRPGIANQH